VYLNIYDISQGMAKQFSKPLLGKSLEGIWHTGLVCYGKEFYFGAGITADQPGKTPFGEPTSIEELGVTHVPVKIFDEYLNQLRPRYTADTYHLLDNNCNNFTADISIFLTGRSIPTKITGLPEDAIASPLGKLIRPLIENMERMLKGSTNPGAAGGLQDGMQPTSVFLVNTSQPALFTLGNLPAIAIKMQQLNAKLEPRHALSPEEEDDLDSLIDFLSVEPEYNCEVARAYYMLIERLLTSWPLTILYPVVDLLRLLVIWLEASFYYATRSTMLGFLIRRVRDGADGSPAPPAFTLMVLRLINNMFATDEGYKAALSPELGTTVIELAIMNMIAEDEQTIIAAASIMFNASSKLDSIEGSCVVRCVATLLHVIPRDPSESRLGDDCIFRLLMALGRILWNDLTAVELAKSAQFSMEKYLDHPAEHIKLVAHEISATLET